ncbi:GrpB family protein [Paenibacillus sp. RC67]|uniref:GrpB family protein n=1 Tax=Paenibacillus sp. RC67 TaxID=3039392 RepID=UPI0024AD63E3|nr:GrpB family protein [Paenibacillus sp. RC67]
MRKTIVAEWTPEWAVRYSEVARLLKDILDTELVRIHHIGSTSIPCIGYAKPIIDILIEVVNIEVISSFNEAMHDEGFSPKGENGIPGRRYFTKGGDQRTHHVHIFEVGHPSIAAHLDFKAYMLEHPQDAADYGQLKLRLAEQFPESVHQYQDGKRSLLENLVQKAAIWAAERRTDC